MKISDKLLKMNPYEPISGNYNIRLDANESPFDIAKDLKKDVLKAIENINFNRYPNSDAKELRLAAADYFGVNEECLAAGNGSDELISVIISSFAQKGSSVMVVEPDFSMYKFYSSLC